MKRILLVFVIVIVANSTQASCVKYVFDFDYRMWAMPGTLTVSWSFGKGPRACGSAGEVITDKNFIVIVSNLFDEPLITDTVTGPSYRFNTVNFQEDHFIIHVQELNGKGYAETNNMVIRIERNGLPLRTAIDSLNFALMNGYFLNVKTVLENINRSDLLNEFITEYNILFPQYYPNEKDFFNYSLNTESVTLLHMAFVNKRDEFIEALNKLNPGKKENGFIVYAKISRDNRLLEYHVIPETSKDQFNGAASLLQFVNPTGETADVVLKIGLTKKKKSDSYILQNERALIDPETGYFRTNFPPPTGAVH